MKPIDLLSAIGAAEEPLLARSQKRQSFHLRDHWKIIPLLAAAACLCLLLTRSLLPFLGHGTGSSGSRDASEAPGMEVETTSDGSVRYDVYAGPVLPLTLEQPDGDIQAKRSTGYDFADFAETREATITDTYTLTNSSTADKTVSLLYPLMSSFDALSQSQYRPQVQINGEDAEYTLLDGAAIEERLLRLGVTPRDGLSHSRSWEDYVSMLSDGSYLAEALGEIDRLQLDLEAPVYVYTFSDLTPADPEDEGDWDWAIHCTGWTLASGIYGGTSQGPAGGPQGWSFADGSQDLRIVSIGAELTDLEYKGYNHELDLEGMVDITATVTVTERTLGQELLERTTAVLGENPYITPEQAFSGLKKDMQDLRDNTGDYFYNGIGQVIGSTLSDGRIFYLSLEVTVPAGGETTVAFTHRKSASYNIDYSQCGQSPESYGYDLMTTLASNLTFTQAGASLTNLGGLTLGDQNLGFDLERGVTAVELDLTVPHYYFSLVEPSQEPSQDP